LNLPGISLNCLMGPYDSVRDLLVVAIGDLTVMKKLSTVTFKEVAMPIWRIVKDMGLSGADIHQLIEEAKAEARSGP